MRRVVVTGLGLVSPLACGVEESWKKLIAGESGVGPITRFDASEISSRIAGEVPYGDGSNGTFNPDDWMTPKDQRRVDTFILFGMAAAVQAVQDAGIDDLSMPASLMIWARTALIRLSWLWRLKKNSGSKFRTMRLKKSRPSRTQSTLSSRRNNF